LGWVGLGWVVKQRISGFGRLWPMGPAGGLGAAWLAWGQPENSRALFCTRRPAPDTIDGSATLTDKLAWLGLGPGSGLGVGLGLGLRLGFRVRVRVRVSLAKQLACIVCGVQADG